MADNDGLKVVANGRDGLNKDYRRADYDGLDNDYDQEMIHKVGLVFSFVHTCFSVVTTRVGVRVEWYH